MDKLSIITKQLVKVIEEYYGCEPSPQDFIEINQTIGCFCVVMLSKMKAINPVISTVCEDQLIEIIKVCPK